MNSLITIEDLRVSLGDTDVLRGVNANLQRGKITALIGLNGSGKTTLLRVLLKEVPYTGKIRFHCGHDHTHPLPEQVGYVPQKLRFDAHMPLTVLDLLALARQKKPLFLGVSRKVREHLAGMFARVGSPPELLDRPFEKISGGEQQHVLLALALEPCPELLLLDEPAAGVDFKDQENFYDLIARLNAEKNVTILLVSHEISMVSRHAHHVLCMIDGKIECEGRPEEIVNREALGKTFGQDMGIFHHTHNHDRLSPSKSGVSPPVGRVSGDAPQTVTNLDGLQPCGDNGSMKSAEDNLTDANLAADTQAVMDHLISKEPLDEETIRRVRERAKRIRQEILERHGIVNVAVDLVREARDES